jgi:hypothetical protein
MATRRENGKIRHPNPRRTLEWRNCTRFQIPPPHNNSKSDFAALEMQERIQVSLARLTMGTGCVFASLYAVALLTVLSIDAVGAFIPGRPFHLLRGYLLTYGIPVIGSSSVLAIGGWLLPRKRDAGRLIALLGTVSLMIAVVVLLIFGRAALQPLLVPVGVPGSIFWHASKFMATYSSLIMGVVIEAFLSVLAIRIATLPARLAEEHANRLFE